MNEHASSDDRDDRRDGTPDGNGDPRLSAARRLLEELKSAEGAEALTPAQRLADVLEDLLEEKGEVQG